MQALRDYSTNVRLGQGFDIKGELNQEAQQRAVAAVGRCYDITKQYGSEEVKIVATSAVRESKNGKQFLSLVKDSLGVNIEILSGEEECRLSFLAVSEDPVLSKFSGTQVAVDVGGGSTEFAYGRGADIANCQSVKIGAVRLTEKLLNFDQPNNVQVKEATDYVMEMLQDNLTDICVDRIVGIGGSLINLARMWNEVPEDKTEDVHNTVLTSSNLEQSVEGMCALSPDKRVTLVGLEPERSDIIIAGAIILDCILKVFGKEELIVSTKGLRHGIAYEMLKNRR